MSIELQTLGFTYVIDSSPGMSCAICRATGRAFLFRKGETDVGICEPCSGLAGWAWRQLAGEVPPGFAEEAAALVSRVYVLIARRKKVPKADALPDAPEADRIIAAPAEIASSYEFLFVDHPDGSMDLPFAPCLGAQTSRAREARVGVVGVAGPQSPKEAMSDKIISASMRALVDIGLSSWKPLLEPLYTAYSPRGRLVGVILARGWAALPTASPVLQAETYKTASHWRQWPLSAHTGLMAGFWRTMESVWALRLYKHCVMGEPEEMCVHVREAARRYIELQAEIRTCMTCPPDLVDTSMLLSLRAGMSPDEIVIERMIRAEVDKPKNEKALVSTRSLQKPPKPKPEKIKKVDDWPELAIAPSTSSTSQDDEPGDEADIGSPGEYEFDGSEND